MLMNLKEKYGISLRVGFDRERYYADRGVTRTGTGRVPVKKEYYYFIKCKYGEICVSSEDELVFYSNSNRIILRMIRTFKKQLNWAINTTDGGAATFKPELIKKILKIAKPRRRRQLTEEQTEALRERLEKARAARK